ncbi:MAG: type II toxin-antitoxin system VapC family toxin [Ktedonobacterales bacterium]
MSTYFLDTSALVKRPVAEPGHAWIESLCDPATGNTVAIVEMSATLARLVRENPPRLSMTDRDTLITYFDLLIQSDYVVVLVNRAIFTRAAALCRIHPLRAYDAVQLACALTRRDDDLAAGQSALIPSFISLPTCIVLILIKPQIGESTP